MSEQSQGWSTDEVVALLQKVELFDGLPEDDLRRVAAIVGGTTLGADEVLFEEGDPGDCFYIVYRGAVQILKTRPDGSEEKLAVRRGGEAFGEMALLNDAPRSATARAQEETQLVTVARDDFQVLLGGDSLALRMMRVLSKALRALGVRFASSDRAGDAKPAAPDPGAVSRLIQRGILPTSAPKVEGFDLAAGTTTEDTGQGGSIWDWIELKDGRSALLCMDVRQQGFPLAYQLGVARGILRATARNSSSVPQLLAAANDALADAGIEGVDQFVDVGVLVAGAAGIEWASAGRVPGGIIRRDGSFEEFGAHGPPLGMMGGFRFNAQTFSMGAGDTAFVLSHASPGLVMGAADLMAQLHGKPAGEVVGTLHKAIRKAQGDARTETSVLYARKH